ncbi:arsenic resistance protein [Microbacterium radiodurans]|uniref:Arsenic resistance protein n=1 Tax=Microbacterium radiodurans TaxID=661398 RepID=A0A5J5IVD4_9MICO|nr:arsenic resistance protein [Microbacterium radiodurans]KAA9089206.1 arsenic resistance protein [Microbacterium radiodurans]
MRDIVAGAERHQIVLYLAAITVGATAGLIVPALGAAVEPAATPILGVLLYVTFLGVPFRSLARAARDLRFLIAVLGVNFVAVPLLAFALSRFVAGDPVLLVGVLLVLLTPCVDYVIVFAGLAGGARERLLAATPLLMLVQLLLLPGYLWLMAGGDTVAAIDPAPFAQAFVLLIVVPLMLAALTQALARRHPRAAEFSAGALAAMVPIMVITLAVVVASQIAAVSGALGSLLAVMPLFAVFAPVAALLGAAGARLARLDVPGRRAVVFSAATRNSLVVLPLALALPASFALVPLVVVTQTLVELVAMVLMVAVVPRAVRQRENPPPYQIEA